MTFLAEPLDKILLINENSFSLETAEGIAIVDRSIQVRAGDKVAYTYFGVMGIGIMTRHEVITEQGEVIEGSALEEISLLGKVMFVAQRTYHATRPII